MEIAYSADTGYCTLLLDAEGVCLKVLIHPVTDIESLVGMPDPDPGLSRIVGAQYVASIDLDAHGGLVALPKTGAPMLFAYVSDETGKIVLIRTGSVVRFDARKPTSGVHSRPAPDDEAGPRTVPMSHPSSARALGLMSSDDEATVPITPAQRERWHALAASAPRTPPPPVKSTVLPPPLPARRPPAPRERAFEAGHEARRADGAARQRGDFSPPPSARVPRDLDAWTDSTRRDSVPPPPPSAPTVRRAQVAEIPVKREDEDELPTLDGTYDDADETSPGMSPDARRHDEPGAPPLESGRRPVASSGPPPLPLPRFARGR